MPLLAFLLRSGEIDLFAVTGMENLDSGVGVYAPDAESYSAFADLFDPIICDYHTGFQPGDKHPARDFGDIETLGNLDPEVIMRDIFIRLCSYFH